MNVYNGNVVLQDETEILPLCSSTPSSSYFDMKYKMADLEATLPFM